jgi:hypothetical protein
LLSGNSVFSEKEAGFMEKNGAKERRVAERFCGLFRRDGSAKPAARLIRDFPREGKPRDLSWDWADIRPEEYREDLAGHLPRLYRRFKNRF